MLSSGEYVSDVSAKSEKRLGTPPVDVGKWTSREAENPWMASLHL